MLAALKPKQRHRAAQGLPPIIPTCPPLAERISAKGSRVEPDNLATRPSRVRRTGSVASEIGFNGTCDDLANYLQRSGTGCEKSFAMLHRLTASKLMAYAKRFTRDHSLAEDIVQESFISIWQKSASFNPDLSGALTWMRVIVRNQAYDDYRKTLCRPVSACSSANLELEQTYEGPCAYVEKVQFWRQVEAALETLRPIQAYAIELAFINNLSYTEVALYIDKPEGTVKTWIRRGLLEIRWCFAS